jgi:hypothetical protein
VESATKFYVFHQRHLGKSADIEEGSSPAEYPVISAAYSQQNTCVMGKAVRESINHTSRKANSEVAANDIRIIHDTRDLIQTLRWQLAIDMDKPKDLPARGARAGIHLPGTTASALDKLITKSSGEPICAIGASAVCDDNLGSGSSLAQMLKEWSYQRGLIEYRYNDRDLRSNASLEIACQMAIMRLCLCRSCSRVHKYRAGRSLPANFRPAVILAQNFEVKQEQVSNNTACFLCSSTRKQWRHPSNQKHANLETGEFI